MAFSPGHSVRSSTSAAARAVLQPHSVRASTTRRQGKSKGRPAEVHNAQATMLTGSDLARMRGLAHSSTSAMPQAGRVLGQNSAKFESNGAFALPKSLDASVKSVKRTLGRTGVKPAGATARVQRMREADHTRRLARAADVSRMEAERGFTENEEEKRMMVEEAANPALRYARQAKQEDLDEIKELNHRMNAARVLKEQEEIIARKRAMEERSAAAEAAWYHEQVHADMVKVSQETAAAKHRAKQQACEYRAQLAAQLEEREYAREIEAEQRELEGAALVRAAQAQKAAEVRAAHAAREAARALREDLDAANARTLAMKHAWQAEEKERDNDVLRHIIHSDKRAREHLAEQQRKEALKKKIQMRMLAEQKRHIDTRSEEDEKRALLHQETERLAQRREAARRRQASADLMQEVLAEREAQIQVKRRQAEESKIVDTVAARYAAEENEKVARREAQEQVAHRRAAKHADDFLKLQIAEKERQRQLAQELKYQEREELRRQAARRTHRVELARADKMAELQAEGVPHSMQAKARVTESKPRAGKFMKPAQQSYKQLLQ